MGLLLEFGAKRRLEACFLNNVSGENTERERKR